MIVKAGSTNVSVYYYIVQDASGTSPGEPVTGLLFSNIETGGSASYVRQGAVRVDLTLITLASASATHADGGFILVDDTNMPGLYRCDYPDDAFVTGVDQTFCQIVVASANNAVAAPILIDIDDSVDQTGDNFTRLGAPAGASVSADIADVPTSAEFNARTLVAANYFDFTSDAVQVGTNNDKAGYSISGTLNTLDDLENLAQTDVVTSGAIQTAVGAVVNVGIVQNLNTIDDGAIKAATIEAGALDGKGDWNIGKTGYTLTQTFPTNFADLSIVASTGLVDFTQAAAAKVLAAGDIDGFTLEETQKLSLSALAGVVAGAATNTMTFEAADGSKTRITATVDVDGNRSVVVKDATG